MNGTLKTQGFDFVAILPDLQIVEADTGRMLVPCYLRPITEAANDFVNAAYATHARGLGNSLVFDNITKLWDAVDGMSLLGLKIEVL